MTSPQIRLYTFAPKDRSGKIRWLLEEMALDYSVHELNIENEENESPEYLQLHPLGLVPVLQDESQAIFESGAICVYLTDRFSEKGMAPLPASPFRGSFLKWIFFSTVTMDPLLIEIFSSRKLPAEGRALKLKEIETEFAKIAETLIVELADRDFLVGGEFSAADIMVAQPLNWAKKAGFLTGYPILEAYLDRLSSRPACRKAALFI